jgi:uncharacterized protein
MKAFPDYDECIRLLTRYSTPPNVISHLVLTTQTALKIAKVITLNDPQIDCDLILAGALLHDIGRCKSHGLDHGILGAQIIREEQYPEELARIAENHLFAGITKYEAVELGLPFQDYLPVNLEEKIITYSDNVSKREPLLTIDEVIDRYREHLPHSHPIIKRVSVLHAEIENLMKNI